MMKFIPFFKLGSDKINKGKTKPPRKRRLALESLENRELLSATVTATDFADIKSQYADLNLGDYEDYNIIEVTELTHEKLQMAIIEARRTTDNDLIVVRTTEEKNTITLVGPELDGSELIVSIPETRFGSITIVSLGPEKLTIDANGQSRVFTVDNSTLTLAGLTITGGVANDEPNGGGIYNNNSLLTIIDCTITGNSASFGAGIYNTGTLTVTKSTISENSASSAGGGVYNTENGTLVMTNSTISENTASDGGGIYGDGTVTNCLIVGNTATGNGGGIYGNDTLIVRSCTIADNTAVSGGGIYVDNDGVTLSLYNTIIVRNFNSNIVTNGKLVGYNNLTTSYIWDEGDNDVYISIQPLFTDAKNGDYSLRSDAMQAIGGGDAEYVFETKDIIGNPRVTGTGVDIGAYQFVEAPNVPENLRSTGKTYQSVTLQWDHVNYAAEYVLRYKITNGDDEWTEIVVPYTKTTALITGLAPYAEYLFQIRARNTVGISDWSYELFVTTEKIILETPPLGNVTTDSYDKIDVTWSEVPNADGYVIQYATDSGFADAEAVTVTSGLSETLTGLAPFTTYYVRVMATGVGVYGDSGYSAAKSATTDKIKLGTPKIGSISATDRGVINVTWSGIANTNEYAIEWATDEEFKDVVGQKNVPGNTTTYGITDLEPCMTYYVRIMATGINAYSDSEWSDTASETTQQIKLTAPTLNVTAVDTETIRVTWNTVGHAVGYVLQYATDDKFADVLAEEELTGTSWVINDLAPNVRYYVRAMALGADLYTDSDWSDTASDTTHKIKLDEPKLVDVTATSRSTIDVTWDEVEHAGGYVVEYATDNTFADAQTDVVTTGTSTTLTGLNPYTTYYVRVMATGIDIYGDSDYSNLMSDRTHKVALEPPEIDDVTATGISTISVTWSEVENAEEYVIEWTTDENFTVIVGTERISNDAGTAYDIVDLAPYTTYHVRVKAIGTGMYDDSEWSAGEFATTERIILTPPKLDDDNVFVLNDNTINISWETVLFASGYRIQYATDDEFTEDVKTQDVDGGDMQIASITGLDPFTTYYFRVMATGAGMYDDSDYSDALSATTTKATLIPPVLGDLLVTGSDSISVTWSEDTNADSYTIEYATNASFTGAVIVEDLTDASTTLTGLTPNTLYYVRVKAIGAGAYESSVWSDSKSATTNKTQLGTPSLVDVTATSSSAISVTWDAVTNAGTYVIQWATDAEFKDNVGTKNITEGTTYDITGLEPHTTYYVRIMATATDNHNASNYSDTKSATTHQIKLATPELDSVIATGSSTIDITWRPVDNADGYIVEYATNDTFTNAETVRVDDTSTTLEGLAAYTTYYVRVMAVGTGRYSDSDYSTVKSDTTEKIKLGTPTLGNVTMTSSSAINVTWNTVPNADRYVVEYATDDEFADAKTVTVTTGTSTTLADLVAKTTYHVRVMAIGAGNYSDSDYSDAKSATTDIAPPVNPVFGDAVKTANSVTLSWQAQEDLTGYMLWYKKTTEVEWTTWMSAPKPTASSITIYGLEANTAYDFRLTVTNAKGSATSTTSATTTSPSDTTKLAATKGVAATSKNATTLSVSWTAVSNASGYVIQYSTDRDFVKDVKVQDVSGTSYDITALTTGARYYVRVIALGTGDYADSNYSSVVSATPVASPIADIPMKVAGAIVASAKSITPPTLSTVTLAWINDSSTEYVIECTSHSHLGIQYVTGENTITTIGLQAGITYKFSIAARNGEKTSAAVTLTAKTLKYAAVKKGKVDNKSRPGTVTFDWMDAKGAPTGAGVTYEVGIYDAKTKVNLFASDMETAIEGVRERYEALAKEITGLGKTGTAKTVTIGKLASQKYTFIVRAASITANGDTVKSEITKFNVAPKAYKAASIKQIAGTQELTGTVSKTYKDGLPSGIAYRRYEYAWYDDRGDSLTRKQYIPLTGTATFDVSDNLWGVLTGSFGGLTSSKGTADKKATIGVWEVLYDSNGNIVAKSAMTKVNVKW